MPFAVDNLNKDSNLKDTRDAITASIEQCISEGKIPRDCAGQIYNTAREKTGHELKEGNS